MDHSFFTRWGARSFRSFSFDLVGFSSRSRRLQNCSDAVCWYDFICARATFICMKTLDSFYLLLCTQTWPKWNFDQMMWKTFWQFKVAHIPDCGHAFFWVILDYHLPSLNNFWEIAHFPISSWFQDMIGTFWIVTSPIRCNFALPCRLNYMKLE